MTPSSDSVCTQHKQLMEEHTATRIACATTIEGLRASIHVFDARVLELIQVVAGSVKAGDGPGLVHSHKNLVERFDEHVDEHAERNRQINEDRRAIARRVVSYIICAAIGGLAILAWTGYKTKEIQGHETGNRSNIVRTGSGGGTGGTSAGP